MFNKQFFYFSKREWLLWCFSVVFIMASFLVFDRNNLLTLIASLIGVTSLIFNAKGHPFGQFLMIIFSLLYGMISLTFSYYGEMLTYLGMTAPMAVFSFFSWLKNPYQEQSSEVKVNRLKYSEVIFMIGYTFVVTFLFYFILKHFQTAYLPLSTLSVSTSFLAVYLTWRRSAFYALAYAANDVVLIVLWILASFAEISYFSVVICFIIFFVNDIYGFMSWTKMQQRQELSL